MSTGRCGERWRPIFSSVHVHVVQGDLRDAPRADNDVSTRQRLGWSGLITSIAGACSHSAPASAGDIGARDTLNCYEQSSSGHVNWRVNMSMSTVSHQSMDRAKTPFAGIRCTCSDRYEKATSSELSAEGAVHIRPGPHRVIELLLCVHVQMCQWRWKGPWVRRPQVLELDQAQQSRWHVGVGRERDNWLGTLRAGNLCGAFEDSSED